MFRERFAKVRRYAQNQDGSAIAEYGVIVSLLALVALTVTETFGSEIRAMADAVVQALAQVQGGGI
jgi:Flp pilus assembly pilin Flp